MAEEQSDNMNAPVAPISLLSGEAQPDVAAGEAPVAVPPVREGPPIPERIRLNDYLGLTLAELYALGESLGVRVGGTRAKHFLIFEIVSFYGRRGAIIEAEGILEIMREGFGLIRDPRFNFVSFPDDVFISPSNLRRYNLQSGLSVKVICRAPRDVKDKFIAVESVESIEGIPAEEYVVPVAFEKLTPLFPTERIILENRRTRAVATRVVDIIAPLGKGQRGLICAPPRGGKTILLKGVALAFLAPVISQAGYFPSLLIRKNRVEGSQRKEAVVECGIDESFEHPQKKTVTVHRFFARNPRLSGL